jgi:hypothetical protein
VDRASGARAGLEMRVHEAKRRSQRLFQEVGEMGRRYGSAGSPSPPRGSRLNDRPSDAANDTAWGDRGRSLSEGVPQVMKFPNA